MNYLTLDLNNGDLVLSNNSVWKSLHTWLNGGTLYSDYYDASNCGDYWGDITHWINIDSNSTYLTFTIEYEFALRCGKVPKSGANLHNFIQKRIILPLFFAKKYYSDLLF